jgi:hypothetical protein
MCRLQDRLALQAEQRVRVRDAGLRLGQHNGEPGGLNSVVVRGIARHGRNPNAVAVPIPSIS